MIIYSFLWRHWHYVSLRISIVAFIFFQKALCSNDVSNCCYEGTRAFVRLGSCPIDMSSMAKSAFGSSCSRSAAVCCLRTLFDKKCSDGERKAHTHSICVAGHDSDNYGAGFERECCECCLLAKQITREGKPCEPLSTFDELCKRSFKKCCAQNLTSVKLPDVVTTDRTKQSQNNNRCWSNHSCEQLCEDHGEASVRCACKPGYKLNDDGKTCSDVNECLANSTFCNPKSERCINSIGSYECVSLLTSSSGCGQGMTFGAGRCIDIDECQDAELVCDTTTEACVNTLGSFECLCRTGFILNITQNKCVDVDECVLERDNTCLVGQRCINTVGSYKCIRTLSCGTGYYLDSETEDCKDVDECALSTHNCGPTYVCRNTKGSFRCEKRVCTSGQILDRITGSCKSVQCDPGFAVGTDGRCHDIDECGNPISCRPHESCINTPGSFYCVNQNSLCKEGFEMDRLLGQCVDIDECTRGTHRCFSRQNCRNVEGSYICECQRGYTFNRITKQCDDINECAAPTGNVCSFHAMCENTPGSFRCKCTDGYTLAADQRSCEDLDECLTGKARCEQRCVNVPGSYQCACDRGFTLSLDGHSCQDIDECSLWSGQSASLCIGQCVNTPGSYTCSCPSGYKASNDGRTCEDIDECILGECRGDDRVCVNTLGSYRCHVVQCPQNYFRDPQYKNRCNRISTLCAANNLDCVNMPMSISHNFISVPSNLKFKNFGLTHLPLFTMKGPRQTDIEVQFDLNLIEVKRQGKPVKPATRSSFLLQKGPEYNTAVVSLNEPLIGPQDVFLELILKVQKRDTLNSNLVAGRALAKLVIHVADKEEFFGIRRMKRAAASASPAVSTAVIINAMWMVDF